MTQPAASLEDRLRLLESCIRGIVMEFDADGRYLEVWTHDESLLARPRAQLLGSTIDEVFGPEVGRPFVQLIGSVLGGGQPSRLEYPLTVLGGPRWFTAEAFPGRRPGTVVLLVQNITDRKQMEARLLESDRLAAIGMLAGGVGHEINNPLAWVMTNLLTVQTELVARGSSAGADVARWAAAVGEAVDGAERIRQIVRDLSFFTRSPDVESRTIDLRRALDWAADMTLAELRHRARLVKVYEAAPMVSASETRLGQVFLNLLINAAQSIPEGDAETNEVRIELGTDSQGRARIEFIDTGRGVAPEHVSLLFEPFFTTKPRGVGTGLGLAISKRIVESLGGVLEVASTEPGATRFRVTLPPARAAAEQRVERTPAAPRPAGARRLRVLVIDDQPRFLSSLQLALASTFDVDTDTSARAALARLAEGHRFDAVVCDLMMPEMSGMDFFAAVAADQPSLATRVVFMTGGAFTPRAREFVGRMTAPMLEKPFRSEELEALLLRLCGDEAELH